MNSRPFAKHPRVHAVVLQERGCHSAHQAREWVSELEDGALRRGQGSRGRDWLAEGVTLKLFGVPRVMVEQRKGSVERDLTPVD